jgi:hypothetical protein
MGGAKGMKVFWLLATVYLMEIDLLFCHIFSSIRLNENAQLRNCIL